MGITFWPVPGTVLMCDFNSNEEPETVKIRRVVVVSSGEARQIMLVVPLSTTPPSRPRRSMSGSEGTMPSSLPEFGRSAIS